MLVNSITSPLFIRGKIPPTVFSSWEKKPQIDLVFYYETVPFYDQNAVKKWEGLQCQEHRTLVDHVKNAIIESIFFLKIIDKGFVFVKMKNHHNSQTLPWL